MNNRLVIAGAGIFVLIFGVAVIIISQSLLLILHPQLQRDADVLITLQGPMLLVGVVFLIVGGIITAIGFIIPVRQQQLDGIHLYHAGQSQGPYPMHWIVEWYRSGKLSEDDLVCVQGRNEWIPVTRFFGANRPQSTPIASPASKLTASPKAAGATTKTATGDVNAILDRITRD